MSARRKALCGEHLAELTRGGAVVDHAVHRDVIAVRGRIAPKRRQRRYHFDGLRRARYDARRRGEVHGNNQHLALAMGSAPAVAMEALRGVLESAARTW